MKNKIERMDRFNKLTPKLPAVLVSYMKERDDTTLPYDEWKEGLKECVTIYNKEHDTNYDSDDCLIKYCTPRVKYIQALMADVEKTLPFFVFNISNPDFHLLKTANQMYKAGETWEKIAEKTGSSVHDIVERLHNAIAKGGKK